MVASEKTSTKPNQDYFNSVFKSKIYFLYICAHALPNKEAKQGSLGQTAARESQNLLKVSISNVEQHLKSKARLIGQLWMGNSNLPNISVRQEKAIPRSCHCVPSSVNLGSFFKSATKRF